MPIRLTILFLTMLLLGSACRTLNRLGPDERLVVKNKLEIVNAEESVNKLQLAYALGGMYRQQPNKKNFFFFRSNIHAWYKHKDRNNRWSKTLMKNFAEAPVIYQDSESQRTALNMQNYMRQRGYFDARCTYETKFSTKTAKVKYILDVGKVHTISAVNYRTTDSVLLQLLPKIQQGSELKVGQAVSVDFFNAEKARITDKLRNDGFAYFVPNNVEFIGDSSNHQVKVTVELLPPTDSTTHKRIYVDEVVVLNNFVPGFNQMQSDSLLSGIYFVSSEKEFSVKPQIIADEITLKPGSLYRQRDFDRTYRNLSNLGVFRLTNIKPTRDSVQSDKLDMTVSLAPNKRVTFGSELEVSQLTGSSQSARLFGTSVNAYMRNRNLFRGAEQLLTSIRYGVDINADSLALKESPIFSQEFRVQSALNIPRFIDYIGLWKTGNRLAFRNFRLISNTLYSRMKEDGDAQFAASFSDLRFTNQFHNVNGNLSFGYILGSKTRNTEYRWNHIGLDVLFVEVKPAFIPILQQNPFLRKSLGDQLFTGLILRDFSWRYFSNNKKRHNWNVRIAAEQSGAEIATAQWLWNIPYPGTTFQFANGRLAFAKYFRLDADLSHVYALDYSNGITIASHIGVSGVTPYGDQSSVPYVKQVFVGGPNSNRAWRTRELGPGLYRDGNQSSFNQYYQTGDLRLDLNAELRFDLIYWFKGALFVDAGNIWTLRPERGPDARTGSEISPVFYDQIAVGAGAGLRFDFDYAIIRLDAAAKIRNPYPDDLGRHLAPRNLRLRDLNFNLALGYPF